jgi:sarcosine oxidase subunit beta
MYFWPITSPGARITNVAVEGAISARAIGRNTTIIRSNYLHPSNTASTSSMKLWEGLSQSSTSTPW